MNDVSHNQLKSLRLKFWILALYSIALTVFVGMLYTKENVPEAIAKKQDVIRAKGIIIEDEKGKDRILIGAPTLYSKYRVRDNHNLAMKAWRGDFPKEYSDWYKEYEHSANGIIFVDEKGFDRIVIGNDVPDPNIGKRIGPSTGILINDQRGFERSGYGLLNVEGENRMTLGLDTDHGAEGLVLTVQDDGFTGIVTSDQNRSIFLGKAPSKNWFTGNEFPYYGLMIKDSSGVVYDLNSEKK